MGWLTTYNQWAQPNAQAQGAPQSPVVGPPHQGGSGLPMSGQQVQPFQGMSPETQGGFLGAGPSTFTNFLQYLYANPEGAGTPDAGAQRTPVMEVLDRGINAGYGKTEQPPPGGTGGPQGGGGPWQSPFGGSGGGTSGGVGAGPNDQGGGGGPGGNQGDPVPEHGVRRRGFTASLGY